MVKLYKYLAEDKKEFVLSKQVLRSGTSIGANIEEAIGAQSKPDFIFKMTIAYKEARETHYWIRLLKDSGYIESQLATSIIKDIESLLKIIGRIQVTSKSSKTNNKVN